MDTTMKKLLAAGALFAGSQLAQAYELVATVSAWDETRWHFDIELADNDIDFTAFQMDITLDGEATLRRDSIHCGSLLTNHNLMLGTPDGYYRVAAYNFGNKKMNGKEGALISFTVVGDVEGISIGGITFVDADCKSVKPALNTEAKDGTEMKEKEVVYDKKGKQSYRIDSRGICIRREK